MVTRSINDRLGAGGYESIAIFSEVDGQVVGFVDPNGNVIKTAILVAQSYTPGVTRTSVNGAGDAVYTTLASITVPAGTMGLNSKLMIIPEWDFPNSASTKTLAVDFGGSVISAINLTTGSIMGKILLEVQNLNSLSAQKTMNGSSYGVSNNARLSTSIDTTLDVVVDFKVKWGAAVLTESITLIGYSIWHYPGT